MGPARRRWVSRLVLGAALGLTGLLAGRPMVSRYRTSQGRDGAATTGFSAVRARAHLDQIARSPRPAGSLAHRRVREYLVEQLNALGLAVTVRHTAVVRPRRDDVHEAGYVVNVHATIPGRAGGPRVLVVAHYDSVPAGPGAGDDGLGVATLLELARVLARDPPARHRIELVCTDAEEVGLLGAAALAATSPGLDGAIVLNLEARGTSGRVVMFETGPNGGFLIPALRRRPPAATSLAEAVYRLLPNDTDFSVLRRAGYTGLNFAVIGESARYHTPCDDLTSIGLPAIQEMGDTVLSACRALAGVPPHRPGRREVTYFPLFGRLVHYPRRLDLALAALAASASVAVLARRGGAPRRSAVLRAAALLPVPVALAGAVGAAAWPLLCRIRPHYARFAFGHPHRPALSGTGLVTIAAGIALGGVVRLSRRYTPAELTTALQGWLAVAGVASAVAKPGTAYVAAWPAALAGTALPWPGRQHLAAAALAGPLVALTVPPILLLFPALGLRRAAAPTALSCLTATAVFTCLDVHDGSGRAWPSVAGLCAAGFGLLVAGALRDRPDARHPAHASLVYAADLDTRRAYWLSQDPAGDGWLDRHVRAGPALVDALLPMLGGVPVRYGPAPLVDLPDPGAALVSRSTRGGTTEFVIRIRPGIEQARMVTVFAGTPAGAVVRASVAGNPVAGGMNCPSARPPWTWGLNVAAPPAEGVELALTVPGTGPLRLKVLTHIDLPIDALPAARPPKLTWSARFSGRGFVTRTFQFPPGSPNPAQPYGVGRRPPPTT